MLAKKATQQYCIVIRHCRTVVVCLTIVECFNCIRDVVSMEMDYGTILSQSGRNSSQGMVGNS